MANVAVMGPPPSPKEPRRSGRRSMPSAPTSSKSPAGSPASDTPPKTKEPPQRPHATSSNSSSKTKRGKQEEHDDTLDDVRKNGVNGHGHGNGNGNGNARSKRRGRDKEKSSVVAALENDEGEDEKPEDPEAAADGEEEEEEAGITRCICGDEEPDSGGEFMAQCEMCKAWQHGQCMGFASIDVMPDHYYCEQCRPDLYPELLKKHAKRARQSSAHSHHTTSGLGHPSRSSRSHSPVIHLKPTKRRNTMNSRDAAYEESVQELLEATAAESAATAAQEANVSTPTGVGSIGDVLGQEVELEPDIIPNGRKKRKRSDEGAPSTKRTRSASIASDRTAVATATSVRDPTPISANPKPTPAPTPTTKSTASRKRGGRKQAQEAASVEGDDAGVTPSNRRQTTNRAKATTGNDQGTRRAQASAANVTGNNSNSHPSTSSRAYHHSHAYAVSQQPLFTSWGLPDYLAHLEEMLPTDVPRPLEVRGTGINTNGRESLEHTTERGVKVKWPSKRMSVGDMNKRVRALVEWVGREQATALERIRRREAIEKALKEMRLDDTNTTTSGNVDAMMLDGDLAASPLQEKRPNMADGVSAPADPLSSAVSGTATMKMMEELMEELILFQERFGPGAKTKERERRTAAS